MPRLEDQVSRWQAICRYVQDGAVDRYGRSAVEASGRLAVRFASYAGHDGLLSRHLVEALPDLDVTTRVHLPPSALAGLAGGDLDAAMVFDLPGQPAPDPVPGTQVATVAVEPSWVLIGEPHPLADRDELSVADIVDSGTPWVTSPPGHPLHDWEVGFLGNQDPRAILEPRPRRQPAPHQRGQGRRTGQPAAPAHRRTNPRTSDTDRVVAPLRRLVSRAAPDRRGRPPGGCAAGLLPPPDPAASPVLAVGPRASRALPRSDSRGVADS